MSSNSSAFDVKYCSLCDAYFYSQAMLQAHIAGSRKHPKCLTCSRSFLNNNSLRNHFVLSSHHHYCRICQKHFKTAAGLRIHLDFSHDDSDNEDSEDDPRPDGWEDQQGYQEDLALGGGEIPIPQEELTPLVSIPTTASESSQNAAPSVGVLKLRCPICLSRRMNMAATRCGHIFCLACISHVLDETKSCPSCRQPAITCQLRSLDLQTSHTQ